MPSHFSDPALPIEPVPIDPVPIDSAPIGPEPPDPLARLPEDLPRYVRPKRSTRPARNCLPAPRFGTGHLLLWLGYTCAYLATHRSLYAGELSLDRMLVLLCQAPARGAAWAGLALTVRQAWRKNSAPAEPGEWLMAITGAYLLVDTALGSRAITVWFQSPETLLATLACLLAVAPTLVDTIMVRWRLYFSLLAVIFAWPLAVEVLAEPPIGQTTWLSRSAELLAGVRYELAVVALAVVVVRDFRAGVRHGWLHWVGLADVLAVLASGALGKLLLEN